MEMLASKKKGNLASRPREGGRERATADTLAPRGKSGLLRKGPLQFKLRDLNMHAQGCEKTTQRVHKMKPSGLHKQ